MAGVSTGLESRKAACDSAGPDPAHAPSTPVRIIFAERSDTMSTTIRLDPEDNVVTATRTLEAGTAVETTVTRGIIPRNHKLATRDIAAGEAVRKYAQVIGYASEDIAAGTHVHTQNVEFRKTSTD